MHAPTLPSLPSWETPIAASRDIVEAIAEAAGSAVDAATSVVSRRRRRPTPAVAWVAIGAAVLAAAAVIQARRHHNGSSAGATQGAASATDRPTPSDTRTNGASHAGDPDPVRVGPR
jgi:hypothetical protein